MILSHIPELDIVGIFDRGVPNKERIVIRPTREVNMGQFGLLLGIKKGNGLASPIWDHFLWFGDGTIKPPEWIFIYTGQGVPRQAKNIPTGEPAAVIHWNKKTTILNDSNIAPILIRVDGVNIAEVPPIDSALPHT